MADGSIILPEAPQTVIPPENGPSSRLGRPQFDMPSLIPDPAKAEIVIDAGDGVTVAIGDQDFTAAAPYIRENPEPPPFGENLAETLDEQALSRLASETLQGIDSDIQSRAEWTSQYNKGIELIGSKIEDVAERATRRNVSRAGHPLMIEAMVKYQPLALDTPIPTPEGWTTMGEIVVGDLVLDECGRPVKVIGLSDVHNDRPCLRIEFDDGFAIVADADHRWSVEEKTGRDRHGWIWRDRDLRSKELVPLKHFIWMSKPLDLPAKELPIDPYIFGLWLGDGHTADGRITIGFADYKATVANLIACGATCRDMQGNGHSQLIVVEGLSAALRAIGVVGNKHIPVDYMRSSRSQRESLLQGLMDSDGHVNKITRQCTFSNTNFELIIQVQELLKTLAIKASLLCVPAMTRTFPDGKERNCQHCYELRFTGDCNQPIFRLPRKRAVQEAAHPTHPRRTKRVKVVDVREVPSVPVRCLAVDSDSHLFLAGLGMVPTHNSGAAAEMLPAAGPAKVPTIGRVGSDEQELAQAFQDDFNYFLTEVATEYYPDTAQMLMHQAFCGVAYKKVYRCPIRRRPVSESVRAIDLIVSEEATDLDNALRVTHQIQMLRTQLRRMQIVGQYRDIDIGQPGAPMGLGQSAQRAIKVNEGLSPGATRPLDQPYEILECDQAIDIDEHVIDGYYERRTPDGLPLPYKLTIERNSQKVLGLWRLWKPNDPLCLKQNAYVKFGLVPSLGYHNWGFLQLLGNQTRVLRAIWRILINAGMFSNFPGGMKDKAARTSTNEIAPGPGEFVDVEVNPGKKLADVVIPLPYKGPDAALIQLSEIVKQDAMRLGGTVMLEVGEGRTNVPVGTILAMIEQQVQVMAEVFKANHRSQKEELRKLRELFADNPSDLSVMVRERPRSPEAQYREWQRAEEFMDLNLQPASDPNAPSSIHRLMSTNVLMMLATQDPSGFDLYEVRKDALRAIGKDPERFLVRPENQSPPPPDPKVAGKQAELAEKLQEAEIGAASKGAELQVKREQIAAEAAQSAAQNETSRIVEGMKQHTEAQKAGMTPGANGGIGGAGAGPRVVGPGGEPLPII